MNELERYFKQNDNRLIHKWDHYFKIHDNHFSRYVNTDVHILEIGVFQGGSLQMWKNYFGPNCKVVGVDINPHCKELEEDQIQIIIGDQEDKAFCEELKKRVPRVDILIDDGGHTAKQQINTFEVLFEHVADDGIYICEDLHTSYNSNFGSGFKNQKSFIEYSKIIIDKLHSWHVTKSPTEISRFTQSVEFLHYYDSILVIQKKKLEAPYRVKTGHASIPNYQRERSITERIIGRLKMYASFSHWKNSLHQS